jgi:hypothetical protein
MIFPRQYLPVPTPGVTDPGPALPRAVDRLELRYGFIEVYDLDGPFLGLFETWHHCEAWLRQRRLDSCYVVRRRVLGSLNSDLILRALSLVEVTSDGEILIYESKSTPP